MNPGEITIVAIIGTILVSGALSYLTYYVKTEKAINTIKQIENQYSPNEVAAMKKSQPL